MTTTRDFDAVDDLINFSVAGLANMAYGSLWVVCKFDDLSANRRLIQLYNGANSRVALAVQSTAKVNSFFGAGLSASATSVVTGRWYLIGAAKATGSNAPRHHILDYSTGTWVHEDAATARADSTADANALRVGANESGGGLMDGLIAAAGGKKDSVLNDAAFELLGQHYKQQLAVASWLVRFDQAAVTDGVTDLTGGGGNESSRTGTTVSSTEQPLPYGLAPLEHFRRRRAA